MSYWETLCSSSVLSDSRVSRLEALLRKRRTLKFWAFMMQTSRTEIIMELVLLFLLPLAVSAMDECDANEECIPQENCPDFQAQKNVWKNLKPKTKARKEALDELKGRVCDKDTKGVCCPSTESQSKACTTRRGWEGTCQLEQSCREFASPIWGSSELTTCGSLTCCPEWAILDRPILSNHVSSRTVPIPKVKKGALCGLEGSVEFVFGIVGKSDLTSKNRIFWSIFPKLWW